ncbi:MAG: hypothetical protein AAGC88_05285 [Bacteroidota bacterium]
MIKVHIREIDLHFVEYFGLAKIIDANEEKEVISYIASYMKQ